ncbi:hypothetical protein [Halobacterium sp. KA-6]|uniref:hypothetical protein n=1 Tax=Halobacterium sp. KA-6 TaxID=2896368 RepID=UPI001E5DDA75|nr:hypothetical protein [Halobacterium sp. KA-6]MCD2204522.1 hypothetical protein [Halobacterium sp. KA-6]
MAATSLKDRPCGHTTLKNTTTLTTHGTEEWSFDLAHEPPLVEHTMGQAGHKPILDAIELVFRPPDRTTIHSPQPRIAPSVDSYFLSHQ